MKIVKKSDNGDYVVFDEDDRPPFEGITLGHIIKDYDGYYRFHPSSGVDMTHKQLRTLAVHVGELN